MKNKDNKNSDLNLGLDSTHEKLINIIKWQGRAVVFLFIFSIVAFFICPQNIKLPNQKALSNPPQITADKIQYKFDIYQDKKRINKNLEIVKQPRIEIIGQVYDYNIVYHRFKDFKIYFNNAEVHLDPQSGYFRIHYQLKEGSNVLEMYYVVNGVKYNRQQIIVYYKKA